MTWAVIKTEEIAGRKVVYSRLGNKRGDPIKLTVNGKEIWKRRFFTIEEAYDFAYDQLVDAVGQDADREMFGDDADRLEGQDIGNH